MTSCDTEIMAAPSIIRFYPSDPAESESEEVKETRLNKLAAFQLLMIKHAMKCGYLTVHGPRSLQRQYDGIANCQNFIFAPQFPP